MPAHWLRSRLLVAALGGLLAGGALTAAMAPHAAANAVPPKAAVAVPAQAWIGQRITADVRRTVVPHGDRITRVVYRWGDGATTTAARLGTASHAYRAAAAYRVHVTVTDVRHLSSSATATIAVTRARPASGSYTAVNQQYTAYRMQLFVSGDRTHLQDITLDLTGLSCAPDGNTVDDHLVVGSVALAPNGTFSTTTTQDGAFAGHKARYTYTVAGRVPPPVRGVQSILGTWKETVRTTDGTGRTCTSNTWPFSATRDSQPAQPTTAPPRGSYTAVNTEFAAYRMYFYVAPDGRALQDLTLDLTGLTCLPAGTTADDHLQIASVPLVHAGTYATTVKENGVFQGNAATYTFTVTGHTHGLAPDGTARLAGTWREDVTTTDGTNITCTTDTWPWTATRDIQPTQPTGRPPAGTYSGVNSEYPAYRIGFSVSPDRTTVTDVSIDLTGLTCIPDGGQLNDHLQLPTANIAADGSFNGAATDTGVIGGKPVTFTYTFSGRSHGVTPTGVPRLAGIWRENIAFTDGSGRTCTTDDWPWTATRSP